MMFTSCTTNACDVPVIHIFGWNRVDRKRVHRYMTTMPKGTKQQAGRDGASKPRRFVVYMPAALARDFRKRCAERDESYTDYIVGAVYVRMSREQR